MSAPVDYIERTREQYSGLGYPPYAWVENPEPPPFTPVAKPLVDARVGLVASGGIYQVGQIAFHHKDDFSYREIATGTPIDELRITHFAYDMTDARDDPNVVFPLGTLRDLVAVGRLGELAETAYTFMGGIYSARRCARTVGAGNRRPARRRRGGRGDPRSRLTGLSSIRWIDCTRGGGAGNLYDQHVQRIFDHRGGKSSSRRLPRFSIGAHGW